jgi:hypothetical protein
MTWRNDDEFSQIVSLPGTTLLVVNDGHKGLGEIGRWLCFPAVMLKSMSTVRGQLDH